MRYGIAMLTAITLLGAAACTKASAPSTPAGLVTTVLYYEAPTIEISASQSGETATTSVERAAPVYYYEAPAITIRAEPVAPVAACSSPRC